MLRGGQPALPAAGRGRVTVDHPGHAADRGVVGGKTAKALATGLDLHTVGDLLCHFPRRYAERGELTDLRVAALGEEVTVLAEVATVDVRPMRARTGKHARGRRRRRRGGTLTLTFFNQAWRERRAAGRPARAVRRQGHRVPRQAAAQPPGVRAARRRRDEAADEIEEFAGALIPVYPAARRCRPGRSPAACGWCWTPSTAPADPLPADLRARRKPGRPATRRCARSTGPADRAALAPARHRLKWDEAFAVQLTLVQRRLPRGRVARPGPARAADGRPAGRVRRRGCRSS